MRAGLTPFLLVALVPGVQAAQEPPAPSPAAVSGQLDGPTAAPSPAPTSSPSPTPETPPAPETVVAANRPRPGRYRLGPVYLTPSFSLGAIGWDSNVFYSAVDRVGDLTASGGPGLKAVVPIKGTLRLTADTEARYLFYLQNESQRGVQGGGRAGLEWSASKTKVQLYQSLDVFWGRPSIEINQRLQRRIETTEAQLSRRVFWRLSLELEASRSHERLPRHAEYLGVDLQPTMNREVDHGRAGLSYALTDFSSLFLEGEREVSRFGRDANRDGRIDRLGFGLRTNAYLSGSVLVGRSWFKPRLDTTGSKPTAFFAEADLSRQVGPKTRLTVRAHRGWSYSYLALDRAPLLSSEQYSFGVEKDLISRLNLELLVGYQQNHNQGEVVLDLPAEAGLTAGRRDNAYDGRADLGYVFRSRLRLGVIAAYTYRRSTIAYFGLRGWTTGVSVRLMP